RFGADVGIGITGIAGPGGGTEAKPVGTVCVCVVARSRDARLERTLRLPGDRATVRERTTTAAMHMLRRVLLEAGAGAGGTRSSGGGGSPRGAASPSGAGEAPAPP